MSIVPKLTTVGDFNYRTFIPTILNIGWILILGTLIKENGEEQTIFIDTGRFRRRYCTVTWTLTLIITRQSSRDSRREINVMNNKN